MWYKTSEKSGPLGNLIVAKKIRRYKILKIIYCFLLSRQLKFDCVSIRLDERKSSHLAPFIH